SATGASRVFNSHRADALFSSLSFSTSFFSRAMGPSSFSVLCESDEISRATTASASVTTSATRASQATILGMPALPDDVIIIIASSSISFSVSTTDVI
ncbi:hypothetical protein PFISCL1PPCAC_21315, partial [Pristionchus fissidentatus]